MTKFPLSKNDLTDFLFFLSGRVDSSSEFPSASLFQSTWESLCSWSESLNQLPTFPQILVWHHQVEVLIKFFFILFYDSWWYVMIELFLCSSSELLVVHLCSFDESATCSAVMDINTDTGSRYPSNTQVDMCLCVSVCVFECVCWGHWGSSPLTQLSPRLIIHEVLGKHSE